jgi:hypothetical protein
VTDVAAKYGVSWRTAHTALVVAARRWLPEPEPTAMLGIDETPVPVRALDPRRRHVEAVGSVDDQFGRLLTLP